MDEKDRIIKELQAELEKARARELDYAETRRAILYMLEDLNDTTAAVSRAKDQWIATFDAITDPIFIHDRDFKIIRANMAYAGAAGMKFKEFIGRPYFEVFPRMDGPLKACVEAIGLAGKAPLETYEEIAVPEAGSVFNVRYYPVIENNGDHIYSVHILEDITERKEFETRLKKEVGVTTSLLAVAEAATATKDMDRLMADVVRAVARVMRADRCLSYLYDRDGDDYQPSHAEGIAHAEAPVFRALRLDRELWIIKRAMMSKEAMVLAAPFEEGEAKGPASGQLHVLFGGAKSILAIPLAGRGGPLGILIALYKSPVTLAESEKMVVRGIRQQVSVALEEARLYKESVDKAMELSHKVETIKVMHEIDRSILSTVGTTEILDTVVRLMSRIVPCDRATVAVVDRERGGFVYRAGFGVDMEKGAFVPFADTSATEVVDTGSIQYASDISLEKWLLPLEKRFLDSGFVSHIRVPLAVKGEVAAVLSIGAKKTGVFTRESMATLDYMASQISVALENSRLFTDLQDLFISTVTTLSKAMDAKSPWTQGHSERVTEYAVMTAKEMGLDEKTIEDLRLAGLLHDIGKIGTYDTILDKPGRLTDEEYALVKMHPARGAEVLAPIKQLRHIVPWIKHHHERHDGKGYPDGLKGVEIPLEARILAVADTFDSMTAERPYRETPGWAKAVQEIEMFAGTQFDPQAAEAFIEALRKMGGHMAPTAETASPVTPAAAKKHRGGHAP